MGRETRMVPPNWEHPKYSDKEVKEQPHLAGRFRPLWEGEDLTRQQKEWDHECNQWEAGLMKDYSSNSFVPKDPEYQYMRYEDYAGRRPSNADRMPNWPKEQRTHCQMYENTSEGTPKSPIFATPEELAHWLADTGASTFGDMTATYEEWLPICKGGWAPSLVMNQTTGVMTSGVAHLAKPQEEGSTVKEATLKAYLNLELEELGVMPPLEVTAIVQYELNTCYVLLHRAVIEKIFTKSIRGGVLSSMTNPDVKWFCHKISQEPLTDKVTAIRLDFKPKD